MSWKGKVEGVGLKRIRESLILSLMTEFDGLVQQFWTLKWIKMNSEETHIVVTFIFSYAYYWIILLVREACKEKNNFLIKICPNVSGVFCTVWQDGSHSDTTLLCVSSHMTPSKPRRVLLQCLLLELYLI